MTECSIRTPALRGRAGFTLIELLIVVVIISILAAIAIPKFSATKEEAFLAAMKSDLKNLATAEEAYAYENSTYFNGPVTTLFQPSSGTTITLANVTASGWGATAQHVSTARQCSIFYGNGGPVGAATVEGKLACTP